MGKDKGIGDEPKISKARIDEKVEQDFDLDFVKAQGEKGVIWMLAAIWKALIEIKELLAKK